MADREHVATTAAALVRQFSHFSDMALAKPVVVTKNGRARNVLISVEEYKRLKRRDQKSFLAEDTPEMFLADIVAAARGADA